RAIIGGLRILHCGLLHGDLGKLEVGVKAKQELAGLHSVAFPHHQLLDPANLVRTDENKLGFHPTLIGGLLFAVIRRERPRRSKEEAKGPHGAFFRPNSNSRCARIRARTSSGENRSNNPDQMIATSAGAISNCGKRASASCARSPRSTARCKERRTVGST